MSEGKASILPASSIDRRLLKAAAKRATAEEMSEAVLGALTPAQCLERVNQLLDSRDYLDEHRERRLMLYEVAEWVAWIKEHRDEPKAWAQVNRSLKLMSDVLERSLVNVEEVSTKLATEHARMFIEGYVQGFNRVLDEMRERSEIDIEEAEVVELMEIGAEAAHGYLDRVTAKGSNDDN